MNSWPFGERSGTFTLEGVRSSYERRSGKGGTHYEVGRLLLRDSQAREHPSMEVDFSESRAAAAEVETFASNPQARSFTRSFHGPWFATALGLVSLALAVGVGRAGLRGAGRVKLRLLDGGRTLSVRRSFFGVPVSSRRIDVTGATHVDVEWKLFKEPLGRAYSPSERTGRVRVFTPAGAIPILSSFARGARVHFEAAERLRLWLGLASTPPESMPVQASGYDWTSWSGRFAAVWVGSCVGALGGIALGALGALTLGGAKLSDPAGGAWYFGGMFVGLAAGIATALYLTSRRRLSR